MPTQSDPALEAFDGLRVREVRAIYRDAFFTFLAKFQSAAASLEPEERIELEVANARENMDLLKAVLADSQADKICSLRWVYDGREDVNSVVPLLTTCCPELGLLQVNFKLYSAFDFASSVLELPGNKIKVLEMSEFTEGDVPRFFAALEQSQVSALSLFNSLVVDFCRGLCEYLARDLLVRLKVRMGNKQVPSELMISLANCTRLAELRMLECEFSQPTAFAQLPKSVTKLMFYGGTFVDGFDWSFLASSGVRELLFCSVGGVDGNQLGSALAVHLRAKGLDELNFRNCYFVNETLAAAGVEIGQIKKLDISRLFFSDNLDDASIKLIALTLQSPNSELRELALPYDGETASSIENYLVPALRHPNCCHLTELRFEANPEHEATARRVEGTFHNRRLLFVLLQGQQVRRKVPCPLRRLPVEMFRLVGQALI